MTTHTVRRAVFPGSFDLFTRGHLDVLQRGLALFDEVIVTLAVNAKKNYFFDPTTRMRLVNEIIAEELTSEQQARVKVEYSSGEFIVDFARDQGATHLIRGIRGPQDFDDEYNIRVFNLHVNPDIEVVYLICRPDLLAISSSAVKENIGLKGWENVAQQFVPAAAMRALRVRAKELKDAAS